VGVIIVVDHVRYICAPYRCSVLLPYFTRLYRHRSLSLLSPPLCTKAQFLTPSVFPSELSLSGLSVLNVLFRRVLTHPRRRQLFGSALSSLVAGQRASPAPLRCDAWDIKSSSSKRVPISLACVQPLLLFHSLTLTQPSKYRGIRMPPNMTKVFNYWGMRDQVDEIGVVTERVIMSKRTRCSSSISRHCLTALLCS
jgi:hypothetical protein